VNKNPDSPSGLSATGVSGFDCKALTSAFNALKIPAENINLSATDRRALLVCLEGLSVNFNNRQTRSSELLFRKVRWVKAPKGTVSVNIRKWTLEEDGIHNRFLDINENVQSHLDSGFFYTSDTHYYIPVHPETDKMPDLIAQLLKNKLGTLIES
jgi:hypothetical protein